MQDLTKKPLADFSNEWKPLPQKIVEIDKTKPAKETPEGMILIPAATKYQFKVSGIEIEGKDEPGVDVQYPWEDIPRRHHDYQMDVAAFYIDKYPVTNEQFKKFVDATKYHPQDDHNFLHDWKDGSFPGRLGEETGDVGFARRRPRLRQVGRQTLAARMGMAVRRPRHG